METAPVSPQIDIPERYITAFWQYYVHAANVRQQLFTATQIETIPGYIDSGADKDVFLAHTPLGPVAIKFVVNLCIPDNPLEPLLAFRRRYTIKNAKPLLHGQDIPNLEQLIAAHADMGILVTTFIEGELFYKLGTQGFDSITSEHVSKLETTLAIMRQRYLHPHNAQGVLFHPETGFSFVDYTFASQYDNRGTIESVDSFLAWLLEAQERYAKLSEANNGQEK